MLRTIAGLIILTLAALGGDVPRGLLTDADRVDLAKVCKHYVNRARFKPRSETQEFVTTLADACEAAQASLHAGSAERMAAAGFLTRLKDLRDTIIDMNMTRVFGTDYTPYTRISYGAGARTEDVRKVSATGEYLIAHRMGLMDAYEHWLDTGPSMALVSKPAQ